ncbi:GHKL domain-containing protein [Enterococcus casseliflavus]|uniref:GHKL domain-containing protein n=1 Tax=Enterococcus casseliflavus TaxID=37734 RepID=UPI001918511C|nr:GHKL domain-containing protein [Enterococcus casseliflavus]QQU19931.1 GHKL domain-containing protein [Enterococcus casseliflavus]
MNLFIVCFFIVGLLVLLLIDRKLVLKRKQIIYLLFLFILCWSVFILFPLQGISFLLFYSLVKFAFVKRNFHTWLVPLLVFVKNLLYLLCIALLFRDLPQFFLGYEAYTKILPQLIVAGLILISFYCFNYITAKVVSSFHLKETLYLVSKTYKLSSLLIVSFFIVMVGVHEYFYFTNNEAAILLGLFLIILSGVGLILFFIFLAKIIYLEKLVENLGESLEVTEVTNNQIKEFRHDYRNILIVLNYYLENKQLTEAHAYLTETIKYSSDLTKKTIDEEIASISNFPLRALLNELSNKIRETKNEIVFELHYHLTTFTPSIGTIDFVRCMSIILNNAYEACLELDKSSLKITIQKKNDLTEIEVKNSYSGNLSLSSSLKKNYSTKKNHSGLGLYNLNKIINSYDTIDLNIEIIDGYFSVKLYFK